MAFRVAAHPHFLGIADGDCHLSFGKNYETKVILEGAFICFICPTAAAVAVVTEKLGGSIGSLTTYTVIANIFTMIIIPSLFPMVEKGADVSFLYMSMMVFRNVTTVLVVPLLFALLSRKFLPRFVDKVKSVKDLGFYMWCFNLTILMGETVRNILHATVSGRILALLLFVPLLVCLIQFAIGKAVGAIGMRTSVAVRLWVRRIRLWVSGSPLHSSIRLLPWLLVLTWCGKT